VGEKENQKAKGKRQKSKIGDTANDPEWRGDSAEKRRRAVPAPENGGDEPPHKEEEWNQLTGEVS
jgi:hypothetical protein